MASAAQQALAFVARRQGSGAAPAAAWAHMLSLELGWLGPADAKDFIATAEGAGLLAPDGEALRVTFAWRDVEVPRKFRLDPEAVRAVATAPATTSAEGGDGFLALVDEVAAKEGKRRADVLAKVTAWQERMGGHLEAEAAALLVAAEAGLDVQERAEAALEKLKRSGPGA